MTGSAGRGGRRERLVTAAQELVYRQGVAQTSLAEVAEAAGAPVGLIYYYFKTKGDLIEAVIDAHAVELRAMFASFSELPGPRERLTAFLRSRAQTGELAARWGCPHGSLSQELSKAGDGLAAASARLMALYVDWATEQFRLMGADDPRELAISLISGLEGATLLSSAFHDPELIARQARHLEHWINTL
jgi:AcrR family transcriptional regulator